MSLLTRFLNLFRKASLEWEFDEELRFHLEKRIARNLQQGMTRAEAEADAHRRFGSIERTKRDMKEARTMKKLFGGLTVAAATLCIVAGAFLWLRRSEPPDVAPYYRIGDAGILPPTLVREWKPYYTPEAMQAKIQGSVLMGCIVQTTGICENIKVTKSLDPDGLDREAIRAVQEWRFRPGTRMGQPVPVLVDIQLSFTLR